MPLLFFANVGFAGCVEETVTDMTYRTKDELIKVHCDTMITAMKYLVRAEKLLDDTVYEDVTAAENRKKLACYEHNAEMAWLVLRKDHGLTEKPNCE
jgi:hypothetical protein